MATRPKIKMPQSERAKQFASFKALGGLEDALEKKRLQMMKRDKKILSEDESAEIDRILSSLKEGDEITVGYYENGGGAETRTVFCGIDTVSRQLTVRGRCIAVEDIEYLSTGKEET